MEPTAPQNQVTKPGVYQGIPPTSQESKVAPVAQSIRTMKGDIADAITKQKETATSIALAEAQKQERQRAEAFAVKQAEEQAKAAALAAMPPKKSHTLAIVLSVVIVSILAGSGVAYQLFGQPTTITLPLVGVLHLGKPAPIAPLSTETPKPVFAPALIAPQTEKRLALGSETLDHISAIIASERTSGLTPGTVENFYFSEIPSMVGDPVIAPSAPASRVLSFLNIEVPGGVLRSLESHFMIGLFGEDGSIAAPFLVLKVIDYDASRAGMLEWEPTLSQSFDKIFSTKISIGVISSAKFRDIIIAGRDARMLNTGGDVGIAYAFVDSQTIVIAGSRTSLGEILPHLAKTF